VFTERGIEFYVFPDGQLDFNTRPQPMATCITDQRQNGVNKTYGGNSEKAIMA
jgi:hypothetical protein